MTLAVAFRVREQLVRQRAEAINSLRAYLYELGHIRTLCPPPRMGPGSHIAIPASGPCRSHKQA
jgi:hypothetical protein